MSNTHLPSLPPTLASHAQVEPQCSTLTTGSALLAWEVEINITLAPTKSGKPGWLSRWVVRARAHMCRHEFHYEDLALIGIPVPPMPPRGAPWKECLKWADQTVGGNHPSHTQRVRWTCCKCGKVFFAHCGLDVLAKHGRVSSHNAKVSNAP